MKILKILDEKIEEYISVWLLATMTLLVFVQVVCRYVFGASLSWSEELARYMFLWLIWMGAAWATKMRSHITIDVVVSRLKGKSKFYVNLVANIIWFVVACIMAYLSIKLTGMIFDRGQVSAALRLPMGLAYLSVTTGFSLMVFRMIQNFIKDFKSYKSLKVENTEGGDIKC